MHLFDRPKQMRHATPAQRFNVLHERNFHWLNSSMKAKNEWRAEYLVEGVDENAMEQPFLPNKPHLVGRAVSLDYCIEQAMHILSIERMKRRVHHFTMKSLTGQLQSLSQPWDSWGGIDPVWYLFGGKLFQVPRQREILEPFDIVFSSSPEVFHATRW